MLGLDAPLACVDVRALQNSQELSDVTGPGVSLEETHSEGGAARVRSPLNAGVESFRDERNVLPSSSERRQLNPHHVQPIIQVVAEAARLHFGSQVTIGGGDYAHVDLNRPYGSDRCELSFL